MSRVDPTCPTDCLTVLPEVDFNLCTPDVNFGQIEYLFIRNIGSGGLADWSDLSEWNTYISNTSSSADAIRRLTVIGSKPAPEKPVVDLSLQRKYYLPKKHLLNIRLDETNLTNYDWLRQLECGGQYLIWWTAQKYMYGGDDGIEATLNFDLIIPESTEELMVFEGTAEWEYQFHPEAQLNIFA